MPQWNDLAARGLEDNVYYSPKYALSLVETVESRKVSFLTLWQGEMLMALLPYTRPGFGLPGLLPGGSAWQTLYTFNCMPLLDRNDAAGVANALVKAIGQIRGGDWIIPQIYLEGPTFIALAAAFSHHRVAWQAQEPFERAFLSAGKTFEVHMQDNISSKRRRDLARSLRKLEELGTVTYESHTRGAGLENAVRAFLKIEAGGWKGQRGTALDCRNDTREFALRAFCSGQPGQSRADMLLLEGKPIAVGMMVQCGDTGYTVKGAYDEAYSSQSAGLLLEIEILKNFLTNPWVKQLDSATAGKHVIDQFWPERRKIVKLAFSYARFLPGQRLALIELTARMRLLAKAGIKRYLGRP